MTTMINFFKTNCGFTLLCLLFPVLWPIFIVWEFMHKKNVTLNDCIFAWNMWLLGCLAYVIVCAILFAIYLGVVQLYLHGYLFITLHILGILIGCTLVYFTIPSAMYWIFSKIHKR